MFVLSKNSAAFRWSFRSTQTEAPDGASYNSSTDSSSPEASLYGERQRYPFSIVSERRMSFELDIVRLARQADLPLLGICGGMQAMNVACGGSLFQDIASQVSTVIQHRQQNRATNLSHTVAVTPGSLLRRIVRSVSMRVNSSHHQSVNAVAPSLVASALAPDGIVEAIESPANRFFLGIQWHPEFLFDRHPLHRRLFEAFLRAARTTDRGA
jgi:putative glutamine amidotransferase